MILYLYFVYCSSPQEIGWGENEDIRRRRRRLFLANKNSCASGNRNDIERNKEKNQVK